jgi:hypothetical protein
VGDGAAAVGAAARGRRVEVGRTDFFVIAAVFGYDSRATVPSAASRAARGRRSRDHLSRIVLRAEPRAPRHRLRRERDTCELALRPPSFPGCGPGHDRQEPACERARQGGGTAAAYRAVLAREP